MKSSYNYLCNYVNKYVKLYKPSTIIKFYKHFINLVKNGGAFDLKRKKEWKFKKGNKYYYKKKKLRYDDPGNIHFGYIGYAFFPKTVLTMGAGGYQLITTAKNKKDKWKFWSSFGDDPRDTQMIKWGYEIHHSQTKKRAKMLNHTRFKKI